MTIRNYIVSALASILMLNGCGQKREEGPATVASASSTSAANPMPDVGKLESIKTSASGFGTTAGEAMTEAMKLALLQVNGAVMQSQSVTSKFGLDVGLNKNSASLRASSFAELVKQSSGGAIQNLQVLSMEEPTDKTPNRYKVTIEAEISKFRPSADMQKIKVVIGPVTFDQATLPMGDKSVPSSEVGTTLRQRISDALVQTGRFAVLDRELSPELSKELDMILSGQAPSSELAKLSQAASADLVWSARVSSFAYNRYSKQLKTSDKQLVSYSGGWALSQKLVNVATRQVTTSESLRGSAPGTEPTTLGTGVDGARAMMDMTDEAVKAIVTSILQRLFPLTVVARDGTNVVISQGGQAINEGARYLVVTLGSELKDPQTGQSLGKVESLCCELVVDRVTPNLSYGHLENARSNLDTLPIGAIQIRGVAKSIASLPTPIQASAAPTSEGGSNSHKSLPTGASEPKSGVNTPTSAANESPRFSWRLFS